ncbi:MAG: YceI family protein [bacterium]|nr:YceI family protein [bacterium]
MKTQNFLATLLVILALIGAGCSNTKDNKSVTENKNLQTASNKGKSYRLVSAESKMEWLGKKVTGQHNGTVNISKGELFADGGKLTGGNFDIDFSTITVSDIENEEMRTKLTGHLKSDDFFTAGTFPLGRFEITSATPLTGAGGNYTIGGKLTIKGITKDISFPAKVNIADDKITAIADFNIDRTLWDIKFRSGKFYENLGDNLISDDFNIKFNITAN